MPRAIPKTILHCNILVILFKLMPPSKEIFYNGVSIFLITFLFFLFSKHTSPTTHTVDHHAPPFPSQDKRCSSCPKQKNQTTNSHVSSLEVKSPPLVTKKPKNHPPQAVAVDNHASIAYSGVARCTQQNCWCTQQFNEVPLLPFI